MSECTATIFVAAIDFGTSYSGYACSSAQDYKTDPMKITANQYWESGCQSLKASEKTPTSLLLDNEGRFVSFGYKAEDDFTNILIDGDPEQCYYFERFKMNLYNKKLNKRMKLKDKNGRELKAYIVFGLSIQALKKNLMDQLTKEGTGVKEEEVLWVLTVPAIWDDSAKQFMRFCAKKAGIQENRLKIALEPEAASVYCQYLQVERTSAQFSVTVPGTRYMVVDLGGGTVDITMHEKLMGGQLKELHKASGGACGGTQVDQEFLNLLEKILGYEFIGLLQDNDNATTYLDLMRDFESFKRTIKPESSGFLNMSIPVAGLDEICNAIHSKGILDLIAMSEYEEKLKVYKNKLRFDAELAKSLFQPVTDSIVSHVRDVIRKISLKNIDILLMVGGFSESAMVQNAISQSFPEKRIINPQNAGLAVLKGAVLFGHNPDSIASRIIRLTYGINITPDFQPDIHRLEYREIIENKAYCRNVFLPIVKMGASLPVGYSIEEVVYTVTKWQNIVPVGIFVTPRKSIEYITDAPCTRIGTVVVFIRNPTETPQKVIVRFIFGDTELRVIAFEEEEKIPCECSLKFI